MIKSAADNPNKNRILLITLQDNGVTETENRGRKTSNKRDVFIVKRNNAATI